MSTSTAAGNHPHRYICLGLRITVTPDIHCRFPMTQGTRGMNGSDVESPGANRLQYQPVRSADFWIMMIIPIHEAAMLADAVLNNLYEFWNADVIEFGAVDGGGGHRVVPRPPTNGHCTVMTVIHDRSLVTEQHMVRVKANGFEMNDDIRLALQPVVDGREAVVTISRENELLSEQRVVKVKDDSFEMRDASGKLTGTIHKTSPGGIPLTDAHGRLVRRLTGEDLAAAFQRSGLGGPSVRSSVSYGLTPAGGDVP